MFWTIYQVHFPAWNLPHICSNMIFLLGLLFRCFMTSICHHLQNLGRGWGFPGGASGKEPACHCRRHNETWVWSLGREDPLQEGMATHSNILGWRISWTEGPAALQSMGSERTEHKWSVVAQSRNFLDPPVLNPFPWNLCLFLLSLLYFVEAYPLVVSWERIHQRQISKDFQQMH